MAGWYRPLGSGLGVGRLPLGNGGGGGRLVGGLPNPLFLSGCFEAPVWVVNYRMEASIQNLNIRS